MNSIQLSVVVIGMNEGKHLVECLCSAAAELAAMKQPVELIYADSGSTDDSVALALAIPGVRVVMAGRHSAAHARNAGSAAAAGTFIQFLDGDMRVEPGWFQRGLEALKDPGVGAAFGKLRELQAARNPYCAAFGLDWNKPAGETPYFGGAVMVRRELFERVGSYDESMRVGEDPELSLRFRAAGARILSVDAPMATHDLGLERFGDYWKRAAAVGKSRVLVFKKSSSFKTAWRALSSVGTVAAAAALMVIALRFPYGIPVLALCAALRWARLVARDLLKGNSFTASFGHGSHLVFGKVPEAQGALTAFLRN